MPASTRRKRELRRRREEEEIAAILEAVREKKAREEGEPAVASPKPASNVEAERKGHRDMPDVAVSTSPSNHALTPTRPQRPERDEENSDLVIDEEPARVRMTTADVNVEARRQLLEISTMRAAFKREMEDFALSTAKHEVEMQQERLALEKREFAVPLRERSLGKPSIPQVIESEESQHGEPVTAVPIAKKSLGEVDSCSRVVSRGDREGVTASTGRTPSTILSGEGSSRGDREDPAILVATGGGKVDHRSTADNSSNVIGGLDHPSRNVAEPSLRDRAVSPVPVVANSER